MAQTWDGLNNREQRFLDALWSADDATFHPQDVVEGRQRLGNVAWNTIINSPALRDLIHSPAFDTWTLSEQGGDLMVWRTQNRPPPPAVGDDDV